MQSGVTRGFTLVELMVTIAVLAILLAIAIPSFLDFRERTVVRGAGDQLVSFWANARLEALKRDRPISVSIKKSASSMCIGASTSATGCNCFNASACDVGQYPESSASEADWHGATATGEPSLGEDTGLAIIDPKRGALSDPNAIGGITIQSPSRQRYQLTLHVDRWARAYLCAPTGSPSILPDYSTRTCTP